MTSWHRGILTHYLCTVIPKSQTGDFSSGIVKKQQKCFKQLSNQSPWQRLKNQMGRIFSPS